MKKNLSPVCIQPKDSLLRSMEAINSSSYHIALVVDASNKLLGILTDGDVRRAMLDGATLKTPAELVMNNDFCSVSYNLSNKDALSLLRSKGLRHLPIVSQDGFLQDLIYIDDLTASVVLPNAVVIMAGGLGKRLLPFTEKCPKPMLMVNGKPMLEILIDQCISYGLTDIFVSVNYLKEQIIDYFQDGSQKGVKISYLIEDKPLGTAGSLQLLPKSLSSPFLVMNGDVLTQLDFRHLLQFHTQNNGIATICGREYEASIPFGVIRHRGSILTSLEEKPTYKHLVNAGIYVLEPSILDLLKLDQALDMPTLLQTAMTKNYQVNVCPIHEYWLDVGRPETLTQAHQEWSRAPHYP